MAAFFTVGLEPSAAMRSSGGEQKAARIRCFALNQRHREFESSSLRHAVTGLWHSPGDEDKKPTCWGDASRTRKRAKDYPAMYKRTRWRSEEDSNSRCRQHCLWTEFCPNLAHYSVE